MSSSRAHARKHDQQHESAKQRPPAHVSRIPTKPTTEDSGKQHRGAQHVARMMKRTGQGTAMVEPAGKSSTKPPTPVTAVAQYSLMPSRRISATPPSFGPPAIRTPSLVSGSSASTFDSPRSTGLRRKPSGAIDRYAAQKKAGLAPMDRERTDVHGLNGAFREDIDNTVLGITIPSTSKLSNRQASPDSAWEMYSKDASRDQTPSVLAYASSATPSTRYSDSPFSPVPTPSSASSYSPSVVATSSSVRSPAKARPGTASSRDNTSRFGLFPVRESSTSTSSTKSAARADHKLPREKQHTATQETATNSVSATTDRPTFRNRLKKANPNVSANRPRVQIPPELAHLNVEVSHTQPDDAKSRTPARPSRSGISTIDGIANQPSIVHSDLPHVYTTYHKRTPSQEPPISASSPTKARFGFSSRASSRTMSPRIDSAISPPPSARQFHRSQTPEFSSSGEGAGIRRKDSPAVSTRQSPAKSPRFGFFSRKAKPEPPKVVDKPKRLSSKGPVAGTGHEGYGRFGFRGRSNSNASSNGVRSSSADSNSSVATRPAAGKRKSSTGSKDGSDLDDFLRERLRPVILRGSGSTMSSDPIGASLEPVSSNASSLDSYPQTQLLPSAMRKASDALVEQRSTARLQRYESSEDDEKTRPNLATRRSLTRLSAGENKAPIRVPPPINTSLSKQRPDIDSFDAEPTAWPRTDSSLPLSEEGKEGLWMKPLNITHSSKQARRWNFLRRAAASLPASDLQETVETTENADVPFHSPPGRAIAHYAMLDRVDMLGLEEVERIVRDSTDFEEDSLSDSDPPTKVVPYERRHPSTIPSPRNSKYGRDAEYVYPTRSKAERQDSMETPELMYAQPVYPHQAADVIEVGHTPSKSRQTPLATRAQTPDMSGRRTSDLAFTDNLNGSSRQPRLSPVGRIPAVVSKRDRDRKLPDISFSRPFVRSQPRPFVKPPGSVYNQIREMASPSESNSQPVSSTSTRSDGIISDPKSIAQTNPSEAVDRTSADLHGTMEFLAFPPRKDSDQSYYCSDSSSIPSWMTTLPPQREDVWNEYNDFMDEVMPLKTPMRTPTTGSSLGAPFQYSSVLWDGNGSSWPIPTRAGLPPTHQLPPTPGLQPTILTVPQQISQFLRPSLSPITPDTISGLGSHISTFPPRQASLRNAQRMYTPQLKRSSFASARASISSSRHSKASAHSRSVSVPDARNSQSGPPYMPQDASLVGVAEAPARRLRRSASLRLGALMTSKWLSFGRVLFSPAHNEVQLADEPRVLVIDGLSSDWSHFVAMSYPSAEVYDLTYHPTEPSTFVGKVPSNHRQIRLSSMSASFPFPKGFFNSVVFRFPTAATEQAYAACLSECKRVLRPGGHLEVSVLDLDLMNMGPKARKAVRGLKTRMQQRDPEVCLKNLSDILVRIVGRRGFEGVQRCVVGVPAAGKIPQSQDMSSSSSSDSSGVSPSNTNKRLSLADLLESSSDFATGINGNDESITKMVARVGRWWYSSCNEGALLPTDRSIWKDRALLRECEHHGTSFRMLICHAQKPLQTRRRTVSV